ncbi:MAG: glutamine--fructose-6-phosphate transaminase (isomerizing) [Legionellales bacterium]|nr:MAG: glutamine--fructose-6-phosphate transaminase (isomerizing) [Legionellales bacterium]
MCGIVAAVAAKDNNIVPVLLEGLTRLEYRGYDSAGIAVLTTAPGIKVLKTTKRVAALVDLVQQQDTQAHIGIAHTRWATHGKPCEANAHPHTAKNRISIVHNGIIENYAALQQQLINQGYKFASETDTEVIAVSIMFALDSGKNLQQAIQATVMQLQGAYALAIMDNTDPDTIIAVRYGSPLVIGRGKNANYIASDALALQQVAEEFIYLNDGDITIIQAQRIQLFTSDGMSADINHRDILKNTLNYNAVDKGGYQHYMHKEIFEQPGALANTINGTFTVPAISMLQQAQAVKIIACGTSYHAGLVAKYWIEDIARKPCDVEIASEYKYREHIIMPNTLLVLISQSGETADILAALNKAETKQYLGTLAICNVAASSLVRQTNYALLTAAGTEIGVAATKTFTAQLVALLLLTAQLADNNKQKIYDTLQQIPQLISAILQLEPEIAKLALCFSNSVSTLFLGRGMMCPIAMEGALKLKEISYIHAEAYPAGELKHGALALVDKNMPVVVLAPNDKLLAKLYSNIQEVKARGGELFVFTSASSSIKSEPRLNVINLPEFPSILAPIAYTIPMQLLSYHVAVHRNLDVDKPRNLAKSVTVE